jgi:hypothetical protein
MGFDYGVGPEQESSAQNHSGRRQDHLPDGQNGGHAHAGHPAGEAHRAKQDLVDADVVEVIGKGACRRYGHGQGVACLEQGK